MKPKSAKAKGRRLQQTVVEMLVEFGIDEADVRSAIMGESGEDIPLSSVGRDRFPFSIECKNTERLSIWSAWKQAMKNAGHHPPIVIFKRNHSEILCTLRFSDLLEVLRGGKANDQSSLR